MERDVDDYGFDNSKRNGVTEKAESPACDFMSGEACYGQADCGHQGKDAHLFGVWNVRLPGFGEREEFTTVDSETASTRSADNECKRQRLEEHAMGVFTEFVSF